MKSLLMTLGHSMPDKLASQLRLRLWALFSLLAMVQAPASAGPQAAVSVETKEASAAEVNVTLHDGSVINGRIVTETEGGHLLLEEANGTYRQIAAETVDTTKQTGRDFSRFDEQQTGSYLQRLMGGGEVTITDHFVICSAASERYTQFCGQLLERVADQFPMTLKKAGVELQPIPKGLAVLIFRTSAELQAFAEQQHPEVDFTDTPGYYSVTHNQILFSADLDDPMARSNSDIARSLRKTPRIIETMVHETVHLLQYNSGLMNRFAANPTWLAEGMAVYFEPANTRSSMLWSRPGSVNPLHLEGLKVAATSTDFGLPFSRLLTDDQAFARADTVRSAYAESWAITWTLMKRHPDAYGRLLNAQRHLKPFVATSSEDRLKLVEQTLEMSLQDLNLEVRKAFRRQL